MKAQVANSPLIFPGSKRLQLLGGRPGLTPSLVNYLKACSFTLWEGIKTKDGYNWLDGRPSGTNTVTMMAAPGIAD